MHIFNGILTGTYTRPAQQCHSEWAWVSLSDLAKHSITRSVARFLCGSWACCFCLLYVRLSVRSVCPLYRPSVRLLPNLQIWYMYFENKWNDFVANLQKWSAVCKGLKRSTMGVRRSHDTVTWCQLSSQKKTLLSIFHYHTKFNKTWQAHIKINVNNILCRDNWDRRG